MKKIILLMLLAGATLSFSCNSNDTGTKKITTEKEAVANKKAGKAIPPSKEAQATAELCDCVNTFLADMSPKVKQILINASKSDNPVQVLTTELQNVNSAEEQQRLAREFERFENDQQLQKCSDNIKKKYNLDENDKAAQQRVMKAAEENKNCEVLYALMKIGMQQEKSANAFENKADQ